MDTQENVGGVHRRWRRHSVPRRLVLPLSSLYSLCGLACRRFPLMFWSTTAGGQLWKSDAVMGTMAGRRGGMSGSATASSSSGPLKQGSIWKVWKVWKARQAGSRG